VLVGEIANKPCKSFVWFTQISADTTSTFRNADQPWKQWTNCSLGCRRQAILTEFANKVLTTGYTIFSNILILSSVTCRCRADWSINLNLMLRRLLAGSQFGFLKCLYKTLTFGDTEEHFYVTVV
jgi:hypothetical protein